MEENECPPDTGTGTALSLNPEVVGPATSSEPSSPRWFDPQQYPPPPAITPQACSRPTLTSSYGPPAIAMGVDERVGGTVSIPLVARPQQITAPLCAKPQN